MRLSEIFDQLTYGELSSLFMGGVDCNGIEPKDYPRITAHVNMALTALYTRFPLKTQEVVIKLRDEVQIYYLDSKYAQTNENDAGEGTPGYIPKDTLDIPKAHRYLDDSLYEPFEDNVLGIEAVHNEIGETLFLNDGTQYWSVHAPAYNAIQIPYPDKENSLIVTYKAAHPKINSDGVRPEEVDVHVPPALVEALLYYIGARAFSNLNADQNAEGNNYMAKYEASCQKVEQLGLFLKDMNTNLKLENAGWV